MVELVDTRDLKSLGNSNGRAGSIPVPGIYNGLPATREVFFILNT